MPLSYTIDPDRRLVTITGDYANASEWLKLAAALLRDRRLKPGFCFIRDLRGATHPQNTKTVIAIFRVVQRFWPNFTPAKGAIVTSPHTTRRSSGWTTSIPCEHIQACVTIRRHPWPSPITQ